MQILLHYLNTKPIIGMLASAVTAVAAIGVSYQETIQLISICLGVVLLVLSVVSKAIDIRQKLQK